MCAPRALARSISSITKNHEPSASTKPSRSLEKGREARVGSLFQLVDMMRINWKPRRIKGDRKSTRLNSSHLGISYAVSCLKKKKQTQPHVAHELPAIWKLAHRSTACAT